MTDPTDRGREDVGSGDLDPTHDETTERVETTQTTETTQTHDTGSENDADEPEQPAGTDDPDNA